MTETKQFDPNKPYCRKDGVPAKIIYTLNSSRYPIVVVSQYSDGREYNYNVSLDGCASIAESGYSLINIPEKHEVTVYFYRNVNKLIYVSSYRCGGELIAKKVITFEEGEGLEEVG